MQMQQTANEDTDIMRHFPTLTKINNFKVTFYVSSSLSGEILGSLYHLLQRNMETMYRMSDWGWHAEEKMAELKHIDARYLIVNDIDGTLVAFCHFRFEVEDEIDVLYVYELQVNEKYRRMGIGKRLMITVELIARKYGMEYVMLTTFKHNIHALNFYTKTLRYIIDDISPSMNGDYDCSYEILSKCVSNRK